MFTLDNIKEAHVTNGADFPKYIIALTSLGVSYYDTFVIDGHSVFYGTSRHSVISEAKYPTINITQESNAAKFSRYLRRHQQGETNYLIFCGHAAESGVEKWTVDTIAMTCTYFGTDGNVMLTEVITDIDSYIH